MATKVGPVLSEENSSENVGYGQRTDERRRLRSYNTLPRPRSLPRALDSEVIKSSVQAVYGWKDFRFQHICTWKKSVYMSKTVQKMGSTFGDVKFASL